MNKKFTVDTIKDLKVKIKDLNEGVIKHYTPKEFKPDDSFHLFTEQCEIDITDSKFVSQMVSALDKYPTEFEAGKILYEKFNTLTPKQASDIGFWAYHNHYTFYQYIAKRWSDLWNKDKVINPSSYILNHWIQSNSSQQELIKYPISGLWWSFYLTVDEEKNDKYELTKVFFKNYSLRVIQMGQTRFARHKPAILGVLEFIKENNLEDKSLEQASRAIIPYINLLGGIRPLSYFDKEWFKLKLENQFSQQIKEGKKLFVRPTLVEDAVNENSNENAYDVENANTSFSRYFCLNAKTGDYQISSKKLKNWDYCIGIDLNVKDQFLIHFYKEGKIKKSKVNGNISNKTIDHSKLYRNGKCPKLSLANLQLIDKPVLFGIAYKKKNVTKFKAMDGNDETFFRSDNSSLRQEGKKILYNDYDEIEYKLLPYSIKEDLGTLVQTPSGGGADIRNKYHNEKWKVLKRFWPELFNENLLFNFED
jgi:hypothetical protein